MVGGGPRARTGVRGLAPDGMDLRHWNRVWAVFPVGLPDSGGGRDRLGILENQFKDGYENQPE